MIINHNMASLNTLNSLNANNTTMQKSLQKLSSGLRINSAADDAAGLAISEKMRGQISGLDQASSNANNGISLLQTAEGALDETTSILQRMRELAVESSSDTLTDEDRTDIQSEFSELIDEVDRIASTTQFNTKNLLDGSMAACTSAVANISANNSLAYGTTSASLSITCTAAGSSITSSTLATCLGLSSGSTFSIAGASVTISDTTTAADLVSAINSGSTSVTAAVDSKGLEITSNTTGTSSNLCSSVLGSAFYSAISSATYCGVATGTAGISAATAASISVTATVSAACTITSTTLATCLGFTCGDTYSIGGASITVSATTTVACLAGAINTCGSMTATVSSTGLVIASTTTGSTSSLNMCATALTALESGTYCMVATGENASTTLRTSLSATTLTSLGDTGNNSLGIQAGDTISFSFVKNGTMTTCTLSVTSCTTLNDLNSKLQSAGAGSLTIATDGSISIQATTAGSEGAVYGLTMTVDDVNGDEVTTASSALSEWTQTQAATDQRANGTSTILIGANTGQTFDVSINAMDATSLGIKGLSVSTFDEADVAISVIDTATQMVSAERGKMGAEENRLEHTINNLTTSSENITSAESRIRDVDMASEMANYTKLSVINQAATAMLAQTNKLPQQVLSLLQ